MNCGGPRAWTDAEIVAALRAWTVETGAPPTTSEWNSGERAAPSWEQDRHRWPSAQLVRSRFGSWDAALRAAGYRARWRGHTPDELIDALSREADTLGRPPTQREWATGSAHRPNASSVARAFGSWAAGLRAAGLEQPAPRRWSDHEIVGALREWSARHDRPPLSSDWRHATPDHPSAALARRRFGSWHAVLDAAGLPPRRIEWTRERVLDAIQHTHRPPRPPAALLAVAPTDQRPDPANPRRDNSLRLMARGHRGLNVQPGPDCIDECGSRSRSAPESKRQIRIGPRDRPSSL